MAVLEPSLKGGTRAEAQRWVRSRYGLPGTRCASDPGEKPATEWALLAFVVLKT
jgi:hypothetical protein